MELNLLISCVTIVVLAAIFAALVAFLARVCEWRIMCPAKQSGKPPAKDAEPAAKPIGLVS